MYEYHTDVTVHLSTFAGNEDEAEQQVKDALATLNSAGVLVLGTSEISPSKANPNEADDE